MYQQRLNRLNSRIILLTGFFLICAVLFTFPYSVQASDSVSYQSLKINTSGGQRSVQAVYVNLQDPAIKVESALAGGRVGQADQMGKIAASVGTPEVEVVAAINGTFFSAYNGVPLPWGTIQTKGHFVHLGNTGTAIGFSRSNQVYMDSLFVSIKGSTNGSYEWPNGWYAWCFNHPYDNPASIVIYTPAFGNVTPVHTMQSVVVDNNRVVEVISGQARIPANGYTIVLGDQEMLKRFSPGTQVECKTEFNVADFNPTPKAGAALDWDDAYTTIGAGPRLLKNGQIVANGVAEGFVEDKITKNRGQRSFIGIKADQTLIMGTVANANIYELAEIAKQLGLSDAMNLDGGASSGLIFKGKYVTTPGRMLSNVLVITRQKAGAVPPIVVLLDDKQLSFDVPPMVQSGRTLVPVRAIFEAMGASVQWDAQANTVTAKKNDRIVVLRVGDRQAMVDNESRTLDVAAQIINDRVMVPLRFVSEAFGAKVDWSPSSGVIHIDRN